MPFKSKKQKRTIDAAAHNPAFAKKVGIKTSDAKKMSAHGKGQTKFEEAKDTVEKDEKGNVKSWKHEGDWKKSNDKEGRGKVTNLSDKARRKTEKLSKAEKEMAEAFENAISEVTITSGPNKGKQWSPKNPGPTNKNYKEIDGNIPSPPDGATAPPPGYKPPQPKSNKSSAVNSDDAEMTAEAKQTYGGKGKQMTKSQHDADVKKKKEKEKMKKMAEAFIQIGRLEQMIFEAKKTKNKEETPKEGNAFGDAVRKAKEDGIQKGEKVKVGGKEYPVKESSKDKECNHTPKGKKCPVHGLKECGMYEGNDGNLANNAKPYDKVTRGDVIAGRLGKDEMGGKKKNKKTTETFMPVKPKQPTPSPIDPIKKGFKKVADKILDKDPKPKSDIGDKNIPEPTTKPLEKSYDEFNEGYTINGKKVSKAAYEKEMSKAGKGKKKVKEGWTHDSLAAQLFENGDEYVVSLHNRLAKQLKG